MLNARSRAVVMRAALGRARILHYPRTIVRTDGIEVYFSRLGLSGATLVVVAVGPDVYGATDPEPVTALHSAARKAAEDRALRGFLVDPNDIVEEGLGKIALFTWGTR